MKEAVSQNEATSEVMRLAFLLCLDVTWGEDPLGCGQWDL